MALYRYFESKNDMLVAAFQYLLGRTALWMASSSHPWVPTRLREIGRAHFDMLTSDIEMWTAPMMQFTISRSTQIHVAAVFVDARFRDGEPDYIRKEGTRETLARYLREGKEQGSVRPDVDVNAFGWQWMSWAQGENLHYLIAEGADGVSREPHLRLLDLIVEDIELPQR
jgi:AcrR family transcriptional regulator